MKKLVLLASLLATFGLAHADNVTVYGTLDVGVTTTSAALSSNANLPGNVSTFPQNASATQRVTGMSSGGLSPSRVGIMGNEDLGGGNKALFVLESAVNVPTGNEPNGRQGLAQTSASGPQTSGDSSLSGQLFGRAAYVGVSNATYGALTLGRQETVGVTAIGQYDPMGAGYAVSPLGWYGGYGAGGDTANARWDNSVKYVYSASGLTATAHYALGGTDNNFTTGSSTGLALDYQTGPAGVTAAYMKSLDALKAANENGTTIPFGQIGLTAADTQSFILAGKYAIGDATIKAGYEGINLNNPSNPTYDATIGAVNGTQVASVTTTAYGTPLKQKMYWIGSDYQLTPATKVAVAYYHLHNSSYESTAGTVTSGDHANYVSALADYSFSKRTDVYLGGVYSQLGGAGFASYASQNVTSVTAGLRVKF